MIFILILLLFISSVVVIIITPYVTRKTESFGVSIPEDVYGHDELVQLRKDFVYRTIIFALIIITISIVSAFVWDRQIWMTLFFIFFLSFIVGSYVIYYQGHKRMKQLKEQSNWQETKLEKTMIDMNFRKKRIHYSYTWFLPAIFITIITFVWTAVSYADFPDRLPMQYGFDGEVTRWAEKSFGSVFSMPLIQLFMVGLIVYLNYTISIAKQQIDPAKPQQSIKQNITFRRRWSGYMIVTVTLLAILFAIIQLSYVFPFNMQVIMMISLVMAGILVIGALILAVLTGQGGSRIKSEDSKNEPYINRDEDRFWKAGIFYFNRSDPAVWVEKRFGVGWTINMARPQAWIIFIIIISIPILISFLA